jgi:hypothetical protein
MLQCMSIQFYILEPKSATWQCLLGGYAPVCLANKVVLLHVRQDGGEQVLGTDLLHDPRFGTTQGLR